MLFTAGLFNTSPHTGIVGVLFLSIWHLFSFLISWQVEAKMLPHIRCKSQRMSRALSSFVVLCRPPSSLVASILLDLHEWVEHKGCMHTWAGGNNCFHLPPSLLYCGWKTACLSGRPVVWNHLVSTTLRHFCHCSKWNWQTVTSQKINTSNITLPRLTSNEAQTCIIMRK